MQEIKKIKALSLKNKTKNVQLAHSIKCPWSRGNVPQFLNWVQIFAFYASMTKRSRIHRKVKQAIAFSAKPMRCASYSMNSWILSFKNTKIHHRVKYFHWSIDSQDPICLKNLQSESILLSSLQSYLCFNFFHFPPRFSPLKKLWRMHILLSRKNFLTSLRSSLYRHPIKSYSKNIVRR